jgi:hypothetical protein
MKKCLLWSVLITILIIILGSSFGGCTPKGIKPLTDAEKAAMIEIALAHPDVSKWLETADVYSTGVGWSAVGWNNSEATGRAILEYEDIADGNLPSDRAFPAQRVTINPEVRIRVGESPGKHLYVAFDREKKEVLAVQLAPGR